MGCSSSRMSSDVHGSDDDASNNDLPDRRTHPINTSSKIKNIALAESTKAISALARWIGLNNTTVKQILEHHREPTLQKPLLYWPCKKCSQHNYVNTETCASCKETQEIKDDSLKIQNEDELPLHVSQSSVLDDALSSIECSICLDTFQQPITLPCGHSLCATHRSDIDGKCPFCRKEFSTTLENRDIADKDLSKNIDVVLKLATILDSDRDTVRDAINNLNASLCVIPPGTIVSLQGLVNATERNGARGVVETYNKESGRYAVLLDGSNKAVSVRPAKLLQHAHIRISGVVSKPEMNGQEGTIVSWCPTKERYNVEITQQQKTVSLKPKNVIFETGTVVRFVGLVKRPEMNGTWGTIEEWAENGRKYDVQLSTQRTIRICMENVRV